MLMFPKNNLFPVYYVQKTTFFFDFDQKFVYSAIKRFGQKIAWVNILIGLHASFGTSMHINNTAHTLYHQSMLHC